MSVSTPLDRRFVSLREHLAGGPAPTEDTAETDQRMHTAVSLVLRAREDLQLLLIKRAESKNDPWSGHMALPGGRRDPEDPDLEGTAIRETREETGVRLDLGPHSLGRLARVTPAAHRLPVLSISPFVFGVPGDTVASVRSPELAAVFWVGLEELRSPDNQGRTLIDLESGSREFPCIRVDGEVVWGLTYRIIIGFLEGTNFPLSPPTPP